MEDLHNLARSMGVFISAGFNNHELWVPCQGMSHRHGRPDPILPSLIRRRGHNRTIRSAAYYSRHAAELWSIKQLYRQKERIHVQMKNRGVPGFIRPRRSEEHTSELQSRG